MVLSSVLRLRLKFDLRCQKRVAAELQKGYLILVQQCNIIPPKILGLNGQRRAFWLMLLLSCLDAPYVLNFTTCLKRAKLPKQVVPSMISFLADFYFTTFARRRSWWWPSSPSFCNSCFFHPLSPRLTSELVWFRHFVFLLATTADLWFLNDNTWW